jgi:acyl-CoA synthetase (AMP-forming)/AMP-acid ligase II
MLIQRFLEETAARRPEKVALVFGSERLTFRTLDRRADAVAHALRRLGVRRGDRVGIYLGNGPETAISIFGVLKASAVFVPVHRGAKPEKLAATLNDCRAAALILDAKAAALGGGERVLERVPSLHGLLVCGGGASDRKSVV